MDDPIFEPWSDDVEAPPPSAPPAPRWRSRPQKPLAAAPRSRLPGTPGFLRSMAVPRLQEIAQRLVMARHEAFVEDLLDESPPLVRFTLRPWRGPLADQTSPVEARLEVGIRDGAEEQIELSYRVEPSDGTATEQERIATTKLGAHWLDGRVLSFVGRLLDRS